jgi:hypothetical protein
LPSSPPQPASPATALPPPVAPSPEPPPPPPAARSQFSETEYRFTTGLRAGEVAAIRGADDRVLLSYRSFASVTGVVAALVSAIVAFAGIAGVALLLAEQAPFRALLALILTLAFSSVIALLVPRVNVTLYDEHNPVLTISQRAVFPTSTFLVTTPNGATLAEFRKTALSRLGRNRWTILHDGRYVGEAIEHSLAGAIARKFLGKFNRSFETNVNIAFGGVLAGRIVRRPDAHGRMDVLELSGNALDARVAVALATLVLGREP